MLSTVAAFRHPPTHIIKPMSLHFGVIGDRQSNILRLRSIKKFSGTVARYNCSKTNSIDSVMDPNETFYHYESGRWLYGEQDQLAKRYVKFDVKALQKIASEAVGCGCSSIRKLAEGFYNKTFCLIMENGQELIARIPNANAGQANISVSSEAATMEFVSFPTAMSNTYILPSALS